MGMILVTHTPGKEDKVETVLAVEVDIQTMYQ